MKIFDETGNVLGEMTKLNQLAYINEGHVHTMILYRLDDNGGIASLLDFDVLFHVRDSDKGYNKAHNAMIESMVEIERKIWDALIAGDDSFTVPVKKNKRSD